MYSVHQFKSIISFNNCQDCRAKGHKIIVILKLSLCSQDSSTEQTHRECVPITNSFEWLIFFPDILCPKELQSEQLTQGQDIQHLPTKDQTMIPLSRLPAETKDRQFVKPSENGRFLIECLPWVCSPFSIICHRSIIWELGECQTVCGILKMHS